MNPRWAGLSKSGSLNIFQLAQPGHVGPRHSGVEAQIFNWLGILAAPIWSMTFSTVLPV